MWCGQGSGTSLTTWQGLCNFGISGGLRSCRPGGLGPDLFMEGLDLGEPSGVLMTILQSGLNIPPFSASPLKKEANPRKNSGTLHLDS